MREWRALLAEHGVTVTSRWINDEHSDRDESRYADYARVDLADIEAADAVIAYSPRENFRTGRGGRHVELGYALARGMRVILVGERENVFHWLCDLAPSIEIAAKMLAA